MKKTLPGSKRIAASATSIMIIILLLAVVAVGAYVVIPGPSQSVVCSIPGKVGCTSTTSAASNTAGNVAGKIQFNIQDLLAGGGQAATVNVYPSKGTVIGGLTYSGLTKSDSGTASSTGTYTTNLEYPVGAVLNVEVTLTNYVSEWFTVVSTGVTPTAQAQGTASQANLFITKLGTFSISVVDDQGHSYTSGTTIANFTKSGFCPTNNKCLGESTINFAVTIRNTVTNTGYVTSTDPLTGHTWGDALEFYTTGSSVTVGAMTSYTRGSDTYWVTPIPDGISDGQATPGGISMQSINSANVGGVYNFNFAVSKGTLAAGSTQNIIIEQQLYASIPFFTANSASWNPSATTTGAASSFTLELAA